MNTPTKIYIGTRNGKDLSIVDENYPNAVEYVNKRYVLDELYGMEKNSVEVEEKYGKGGYELYLKMLGYLRGLEEL